MNQQERQLILRQVDQLVQNTRYQVLRNECYQRRMISDAMIAIIEDRIPDDASRHKKLFEKITKRGPTAFQTLLDICQQNFPPAYDLLRGGSPGASSSTNNQNINSSNMLSVNEKNDDSQYHSTYNPNRHRSISVGHPGASGPMIPLQQKMHRLSIGSPRNFPLEDDLKNNNDRTDKPCKHLDVFQDKVEEHPGFKVVLTNRPPKTKYLDAYPMRSRNRGVVFILNIITYINDTHPKRNGADVDKDNLVYLFRQLGFTVFYYEDLSRGDFMDLMEQLKASDYLSTECFAFYVLAHGNHTKGRDKIYLNDNSVLFVEEILRLFNNTECPRLIRKPKLFFFSICRGDQADIGTLRPSEHTERDGMINPKTDPPTNMPTYADMFICFSTVPGFAAHRDKFKGSWFVESMCDEWAKHAHDTDVEQLMKLVGKNTSMYRTEQNNLQTLASEQRGFFDLLYLNPGYYAD
ncbi:caspase Dronc [Uranotaenia lowii]|uniref:caspase Dronc n=1 Tax=Uranotaenia lowii TaxID=190385 RepID=UPI002479DC07|nr:caspase Dronc [Uranotaenia lowii]